MIKPPIPFFDTAEVVDFASSDYIVQQYDKADDLYILKEGKIEFSVQIKDELEPIIVGHSEKQHTPVGWSGFKEPKRYSTTVKALDRSQFYHWKIDDLLKNMMEEPEKGVLFLQFIYDNANLLLEDTKRLIAQLSPQNKFTFDKIKKITTETKFAEITLNSFFKESPFFETFSDEEIKLLAPFVEVVELQRGDKLGLQNQHIGLFSILSDGKIAIINKSEACVDSRILENSGYIISADCFLTNSISQSTIIALASSQIVNIQHRKLNKLFEANPSFKLRFYLRLIWFKNVRLRSARAKLIRVQFDGEISAVNHIIEQHITELSVTSEIHKIPYLLKNTLTLNEAIIKLNKLKKKGSSLERRLAKTSLSMLSEVIRENDFYNGLSNIYEAVANAPSIFNPKELRALCATYFIDLFEKIGYVLKGVENLPKEPAIYIYNHLENHVYNTLPNGFQLTLDSHFISSVILFQHLGNAGVRVVRIPRGVEFGHQKYYERLGHIPVYTKDSSKPIGLEKEELRSTFYQRAQQHLNEGTSILLAPEGQSFSTEQSPGDFKPGAFVLASKMEKEPLIVPIAVANFDQRINRTQFSVTIKKPLKLSHYIKNPKNHQEMNAFLDNLKIQYKTYIEEAKNNAALNPWEELL